MRIQHNISAMNSYRNFSANNSSLSKNLEKLSTGYKINRAGDDAAGLAISEKMRAQISGLEGATKNAKDGISLVQTAEGALTEVHDMLNRMTTLAEQSANGTYQNELDREQLQKEIGQLKSEIDRIADSTNFNGLKLLDGSLAENTAAVNNETQLATIKTGAGNTGVTATGKFQNASGDTYAITAGTLGEDGKYTAFNISFTDASGEEYELTLVGDADNDTTLATNGDLATALNTGKGLTLTVAAGKDQETALKAFHDSFNAAAPASNLTTGAITLQVKDTAIGAKLTGVKVTTQAADAATAVSSAVAIGPTKTDGKAAGYEVTLAGTAAAVGDTFSIGDKTYEYVAASGDPVSTAGATGIVRGANLTSATKNLYDALKNDGYDVLLDDGTGANGKIRFTNMEQISEAQVGASVSETADNLVIRNQEASKQTTVIKENATANATGTYQMTVGYVDGEGKNQSKTISYKMDTNAAGDEAKAISNAIKADEDLNKLFDVDDTTAGQVKLTAKSTDNSVGQLATFTTNATNKTSTEITAGVNDGKAIELRNPNGNEKNIVAGDTVTVNGKTYEFAASGSSSIGEGNIRVLVGSDGKNSMKNLSDKMTENGIVNSYDAATGKIVMRDVDNVMEETTGGLRLQIGDTSDNYNQLTVSVSDMHSAAIGIGDVDISTQDGAAAALDKIKAAVNKVSDVRGNLGALQNRLDHTINNLGVQRENIQNAESLIRDTDVAEEMMAYTKNNILNQSAQAMLAQANQLPQGVLQLLG